MEKVTLWTVVTVKRGWCESGFFDEKRWWRYERNALNSQMDVDVEIVVAGPVSEGGSIAKGGSGVGRDTGSPAFARSR